MRLDSLFRLSTYLTLGVATLCLATMEEPFLTGMTFSFIPIGLLLVAAYRVRARWKLSLAASNAVGFLIASGSAAWIVYEVFYSPPAWTHSVPYPAAFLPFAGPVLMLLLAAKLFRTDEITDYWSLQLIGLLEVALACVLAAEPYFAFLLLSYVLCCSWSLILFFHYRQQLQVAGEMEGANKGEPQTSLQASTADQGTLPIVAWRGWAVGAEAGRALILLLLGVGIFLLTPQWSETQWQLAAVAEGMTSVPGEVGFSPRIDLNHTGQLQVTDKLAFQVVATDANGAPKTDLSREQRWRGMTLDSYQHGRWLHRFVDAAPKPGSRSFVTPGTPADLPGLGSNQYFLRFSVKLDDVAGLFLADPVVLGNDEAAPVVGIADSSAAPWFHLRDCTLLRNPRQSGKDYEYIQVRSPAGSEMLPAYKLSRYYEDRLLEQPVARIRPWTRKLLDRLAKRGNLPEGAWPIPDGEVMGPDKRTAVALALTEHLAISGDYRYTLELKRTDPTLDPAEDFLVNVKQGHCEYYATGLVLMLRSAGIPARIVNGFRGAETPEDAPRGTYVVREKQAHTWVEALVGDEARGRGLFWLTLDPTPSVLGSSAGGSFAWSQLWDTTANSFRAIWKNVFMETHRNPIYDQIGDLATSTFSAENVESSLAWGRRWSAGAGLWASLVAALAAGLTLFLALRRALWISKSGQAKARGATPEMRLYRQWLTAIAKRLALVPTASDTPLEFAHVVGEAIEQDPSMTEWTGLSQAFVKLFYRARYGGQPLSAAEREEWERRLTDIEPTISHGEQ